jgi:hypothetical protein
VFNARCLSCTCSLSGIDQDIEKTRRVLLCVKHDREMIGHGIYVHIRCRIVHTSESVVMVCEAIRTNSDFRFHRRSIKEEEEEATIYNPFLRRRTIKLRLNPIDVISVAVSLSRGHL